MNDIKERFNSNFDDLVDDLSDNKMFLIHYRTDKHKNMKFYKVELTKGRATPYKVIYNFDGGASSFSVHKDRKVVLGFTSNPVKVTDVLKNLISKDSRGVNKKSKPGFMGVQI